jgi:arsenate reductase-like glutaredoxin family protein
MVHGKMGKRLSKNQCFTANRAVEYILVYSVFQSTLHIINPNIKLGEFQAVQRNLGGGFLVNIQIFGKSKCFDTKKAERYFKERRIKYQLVDIVKFGLSKGEYQSVKNAVGGMDALIDEKSKEYEARHIQYLADKADVEESLMENPGMFKTPIVRNGKKATIGYQPDIWTVWEKGE